MRSHPKSSRPPGIHGTPVRLQKFMSEAGVASRRHSEELIAAGAVTVNGRIATIGDKVVPGRDTVAVRGRPVAAAAPKHATFAFHKPRGVLSSHGDPHHSRTVFSLLPKELAGMRLLLAGRLDKDSEGLLILTTDGTLVQRLTHPSSGIVKRYRIALQKPFPKAKIPLLLKGFEEEGEWLQAEKVISIDAGKEPAGSVYEVHLHHGRKREIRRLFEHFGCRVRRLTRFQIGGFALSGIPVGAARPLTDAQIRKLLSPG